MQSTSMCKRNMSPLQSKYQGIIFDLDGVICHTDKFHYLAWKTMTDKHGIYFDERINDRLRGVSRMESLDVILERYEGPGLSDRERLLFAEEKNEVYKSLLMQMDENDVPEDVVSTLNALREMGVKLAIGSSSKNAQLILGRIGLGSFFDAVSDGNSISHSKPHPEVFLLAAKLVGLPPAGCLVVEDARAGIEAAVRGGFDSVGIGDAAGDERATYKIFSFCELVDIVYANKEDTH